MTESNKAQKSKAKAALEAVLAALDANDDQVPANPSLFTFDKKRPDESFEKLFRAEVDKNDFKVGEASFGKLFPDNVINLFNNLFKSQRSGINNVGLTGYLHRSCTS